MRMSRRAGVYSTGKRTAIVSVYGAASETVTLTHSDGTVYSMTANNGSTKEIPMGAYTVKGGVSGYSKSVTVTKDTTRINAWPDGATIYYWYGYSPVGSWAATASVANYVTHTDMATAPGITPNTNSVYIVSAGGYSRCGSAYLPKTTISGSTLKLVCSGAYQNGYGSYLSLNLTSSISNPYAPATYTDISSGGTSASINISPYSGGQYYLTINVGTCNYDGGSKQSYITIKELYSV